MKSVIVVCIVCGHPHQFNAHTAYKVGDKVAHNCDECPSGVAIVDNVSESQHF